MRKILGQLTGSMRTALKTAKVAGGILGFIIVLGFLNMFLRTTIPRWQEIELVLTVGAIVYLAASYVRAEKRADAAQKREWGDAAWVKADDEFERVKAQQEEVFGQLFTGINDLVTLNQRQEETISHLIALARNAKIVPEDRLVFLEDSAVSMEAKLAQLRLVVDESRQKIIKRGREPGSGVYRNSDEFVADVTRRYAEALRDGRHLTQEDMASRIGLSLDRFKQLRRQAGKECGFEWPPKTS